MAVGPGTPSSRARGLHVGLTDIARWRAEDEVHLPEAPPRAPAFLPEPRPLDAILRRETLDERLSGFLVPAELDPDLLAPAMMSETRQSLAGKMALLADAGGPAVLDLAAALLEREVELDEEVRAALAALLRA